MELSIGMSVVSVLKDVICVSQHGTSVAVTLHVAFKNVRRVAKICEPIFVLETWFPCAHTYVVHASDPSGNITHLIIKHVAFPPIYPYSYTHTHTHFQEQIILT